MKILLFILFLLCFPGRAYLQTPPVKIAQIDVAVQGNTFQLYISKVPEFKSDDEVMELIFYFYILEHSEDEIKKKIQEIQKSKCQIVKPKEKTNILRT